MTGLQFLRKVAARLGNNPDAALDEPLPLPIGLKTSRGISPNTERMRSIASMMSVRRGMSERAATRTRVRQFLQFAAAKSCAGCHAS